MTLPFVSELSADIGNMLQTHRASPSSSTSHPQRKLGISRIGSRRTILRSDMADHLTIMYFLSYYCQLTLLISKTLVYGSRICSSPGVSADRDSYNTESECFQCCEESQASRETLECTFQANTVDTS